MQGRGQSSRTEILTLTNILYISISCGLDTETYQGQHEFIYGDTTCPSIIILLLITYFNQFCIFFGSLNGFAKSYLLTKKLKLRILKSWDLFRVHFYFLPKFCASCKRGDTNYLINSTKIWIYFLNTWTKSNWYNLYILLFYYLTWLYFSLKRSPKKTCNTWKVNFFKKNRHQLNPGLSVGKVINY